MTPSKSKSSQIRWGWWAMTIMGTLIAVSALRYFSRDPNVFFSHQAQTYLANLNLLLVHIGFGVVAILTGPWQFLPRFRARYKKVHRWVGLTYATSIFISGVAGLFVAQQAFGGILATLGFSMLSLLWMTATTGGLVRAYQKKWAKHQVWMIYSFALTFAFVTFRMWLALPLLVPISFESAYVLSSWLCWAGNLLFVRFWLLKKPAKAPLNGHNAAAPL